MNNIHCIVIAQIDTLISSMQVRSKFTIDDHSHYLFTPRDLTQWVLGLLRYDLNGAASSETSSEHVLEVWSYEACRLFRDRLVGEDARNRFDNILNGTLQADWNAGHVLQNLNGKLECSYDLLRFIMIYYDLL